MLAEPIHPEAIAASKCMHRGFELSQRPETHMEAHSHFALAISHYTAACSASSSDYHHWCLAGAWIHWSDAWCRSGHLDAASFRSSLQGLHTGLVALTHVHLDAEPEYRDRFILIHLRLAEVMAACGEVDQAMVHLAQADEALAGGAHQRAASRTLLRIAQRVALGRMQLDQGALQDALATSAEVASQISTALPDEVALAVHGFRCTVLATALEQSADVDSETSFLAALQQHAAATLQLAKKAGAKPWGDWLRFCATLQRQWNPAALEPLTGQFLVQAGHMPAALRQTTRNFLKGELLLAIQQIELTAYQHSLDDTIMAEQSRLLASLQQAYRRLCALPASRSLHVACP